MKKMYYEICSCNPANGGNGICGCTMGNRLVDTENTYTTITTTTTGALIDKIKPQMKQTAVEWLFAHLLPFLEFSDPKEREYYRKCLAEANAMFEEQITDAFGVGCQVESTRLVGYHSMAEQYYNETYGGDK